MKKIFGLIMTMVMVVMFAFANAELKDYIKQEDWHFISEDFNMEEDHKNAVTVVEDSIYIYGYNSTVSSEFNGLSDKELMEKMTEEFRKLGINNPAVFAKTLHDGIIVVYVHSDKDLSEIEDVKCMLERYELNHNEIYNFNVICWRDYASMK